VSRHLALVPPTDDCSAASCRARWIEESQREVDERVERWKLHNRIWARFVFGLECLGWLVLGTAAAWIGIRLGQLYLRLAGLPL